MAFLYVACSVNTNLLYQKKESQQRRKKAIRIIKKCPCNLQKDGNKNNNVWKEREKKACKNTLNAFVENKPKTEVSFSHLHN